MGYIARFRWEIVAILLIASLYFSLRLFNLGTLPIFTDEAIYIRWAQIGLQDPNWRFISLSDGKQPLFTWVMMVTLKLINDPLIAGRMVSVLAGVFSIIALWFISYELFKNKRIAYLASLIYVVFPFAQVVDRMALYDSLSGAFTLWASYFSILLIRKARLDIAYTLGLTIGFGVLNKSTNFFSIYLLPFTLILFNYAKKNRLKRIIKVALLALFAVVLSIAMYSILRLSGLFHMVEQKNALFIYPFSEWINHPFDFFLGNLHGMINWTIEYLKWPFVALIILSFRDRKFTKEKIFLFLYFFLPFIALALFARILFPRFIFFMTLPLLPLIAYGLYDIIDLATKKLVKKVNRLKLTFILLLIAFAFMVYPLYVSYQFAFDPVNSRIAKPDNAQYVNHWTAGWGVVETVDFFEEISSKESVFIATEGTFGLMPFALEIYLSDNPNITIKGYWPLEKELPREVLEMAKKKKTYIIFYQPNNVDPPNPENLKLIFKKQAGNSMYYYRLYEVIPSSL